MDTKLYLRILLFFLSIIHFSCNSTQGIYNVLSAKKGSLKYIYKSNQKPVTLDRCVHISIPVVTDERFARSGSLVSLESHVIPLLVYNQWKTIRNYRIGKSNIQEDIPSFIRSAIVEESARGGSFKADTSSRADQFTLEIELDSLGAGGLHISQGEILYALFMYVYSTSEVAGPGIAYSQFQYRLKKGDTVVLKDRVYSRKVTQPLVTNHRSTKLLRQSYTSSLVEALSLTFKSNIEAIVVNLNLFFDHPLAEN